MCYLQVWCIIIFNVILIFDVIVLIRDPENTTTTIIVMLIMQRSREHVLTTAVGRSSCQLCSLGRGASSLSLSLSLSLSWCFQNRHHQHPSWQRCFQVCHCHHLKISKQMNTPRYMLDSQAPLDHAKRNMMGSARVVVAANLLFVPFAAMMLVKHSSLMRTFVVYSFSSFHNEFENGNLIMNHNLWSSLCFAGDVRQGSEQTRDPIYKTSIVNWSLNQESRQFGFLQSKRKRWTSPFIRPMFPVDWC